MHTFLPLNLIMLFLGKSDSNINIFFNVNSNFYFCKTSFDYILNIPQCWVLYVLNEYYK